MWPFGGRVKDSVSGEGKCKRIFYSISQRALFGRPQLMLDEGGTGRVTWPEFEALVQACASSEQMSRQQIRVGSAEADIMRTLVRDPSKSFIPRALQTFVFTLQTAFCFRAAALSPNANGLC